MKKVLLASATLVALTAPALAQVPGSPPQLPAAEDKFIKQDANGDGALSIDEVKSADAQTSQADFDKYDADKSKTISKDEFKKWVEAKSTPPASAPGQ